LFPLYLLETQTNSLALAPIMRIVAFLLIMVFFYSCRPEEYVPKRRSYARVDTPAEHTYQTFDQANFPYTFEYPTYANISRDTLIFEKTPDNSYWININFPEMGSTIYLSYKNINSSQTLAKLLEDAHFMSYYHTKKADYLQSDFSFRNNQGVQGYLYEWGGDAASKYQFVATDSLHHFIRGALYFNCTPNADSLKPLNDFIKTDIQQLLKTIRWK
jgi:gliding motility-associated lipoprotein GldD